MILLLEVLFIFNTMELPLALAAEHLDHGEPTFRSFTLCYALLQ